MSEMADSDDDGSLPAWRAYLRRYPVVGDALAAARRGEGTAMRSGDRLTYSMQVLADADGLGGAVETVYYLSYLDAAETAMMSAAADGTPDQGVLAQAVVRWIASALSEPGIDEWLTDSVRKRSEVEPGDILNGLPDPVEVVALDIPPEEGDAFPARFGIRELVRVNGSETWEDVETDAYRVIGVFAETIQFKDAPQSLRRTLLEAGGRLVTCSSCGDYLTNGFAEWPGLWCALDEEGPVCRGPLGRSSGRPVPHNPEVVE
ncbi:MAG: hypothetical protein ACYCO9_00400 [Streptosporangiaceae bacterium]